MTTEEAYNKGFTDALARVREVSRELVKEFHDNLITIAIENEHMRGCVTSNQIIQALKDFEASQHPSLTSLSDKPLPH